MKPGKGRQWPSTERTAPLQETDGRTGRLFDVNIDRLARAQKMPRYAAPTRHEGKALMRHTLPSPLPVAPLSFSMSAGSTGGALVASAGAAYRLPASELGAIPGAVQVPAIALRADAHLHPAATAVIEPVSPRLLERPQDPLPDGTGQGRGGEA
jgi:hypothetical protein